MSLNQEDVIAALGNMSVIELIQLTKDLEAKWGVEAKPQVAQLTMVQDQPATVSQTEFDVHLVSYPADKKITLVKVVREVLGLGLLESKTLVESVPKMVKEGLSKDEADALKAKLMEAGAVVEVK